MDKDIFKMMTWKPTKLASRIDGFDPRGGATIIEVNGSILIFGGADREQCHFADLAICRPTGQKTEWTKVETNGDIPMPRSGHSVTSYGKYMFLFGGIDFAEEAVFNDLYALDTESLEWSYIGEGGDEVPARNSHCLQVLRMDREGQSVGGQQSSNFLVLFGGASPDAGPMADAYVASLPAEGTTIDSSSFVKWRRVSEAVEASGPSAREMHSSVALGAHMVITGGRSETAVLADSWTLTVGSSVLEGAQCCPVVGSDDEAVAGYVSWARNTHVDMPHGRCAHGAALLDDSLVLFGGLTSEGGLTDDLSVFGLQLKVNPTAAAASVSTSTSTSATGAQRAAPVKLAQLGPRLSPAVCRAPLWLLDLPASNSSSSSSSSSSSAPSTVFRATAGEGGGEGEAGAVSEAGCGILIFGGVSFEHDFNDVWLLQKL